MYLLQDELEDFKNRESLIQRVLDILREQLRIKIPEEKTQAYTRAQFSRILGIDASYFTKDKKMKKKKIFADLFEENICSDKKTARIPYYKLLGPVNNKWRRDKTKKGILLRTTDDLVELFIYENCEDYIEYRLADLEKENKKN
jgi:hypothetical protein